MLKLSSLSRVFYFLHPLLPYKVSNIPRFFVVILIFQSLFTAWRKELIWKIKVKKFWKQKLYKYKYTLSKSKQNICEILMVRNHVYRILSLMRKQIFLTIFHLNSPCLNECCRYNGGINRIPVIFCKRS